MPARLDQARSALASGDPTEALRQFEKLLRGPVEPQLLVEAAEYALPLDPALAERLARRALDVDGRDARATHHLAEAVARQGDPLRALDLFRSALATDGRLADMRSDSEEPGGAAWIGRFGAVPCPTCDSENALPVWAGNISVVFRTWGLVDPLRSWVKCDDCGLVRVAAPPLPAALDAWRSAGTLDDEAPPRIETLSEVLRSHDHVIERIRRAGHGTRWVDRGGQRPRLLEVGATWGTFQAAADWRGFQTTGLLRSEKGARWTRDRLKVDAVHSPSLHDMPDGPFDVVVAWERLDRILDPLGMLMSLAARLEPGGVLALSTPSLDHPAHLAQGYDDVLWSDPERRVWFDRETLALTMLNVGLQPTGAWYDERRAGSIVVIAHREGG